MTKSLANSTKHIIIYGEQSFSWIFSAVLLQAGYSVALMNPFEQLINTVSAVDLQLLILQKSETGHFIHIRQSITDSIHVNDHETFKLLNQATWHVFTSLIDQSSLIKLFESMQITEHIEYSPQYSTKSQTQKSQHVIQPQRQVVIQVPLHLGALDELQLALTQHNLSIHVIGMPLFIREGSEWQDITHPWLLLLSGKSEYTEQWLQLLTPALAQIKQIQCTVHHKTAEMIRIATNTMLATRISLINEMANLAEYYDIDIQDITDGLGADPRIGRDFLNAGCGFGGEKFNKELQYYTDISRTHLRRQGLVETVLDINTHQQEVLFRKLWRFFSGDLKGKTIAILGCAYKPESNSITYSPIHTILSALWSQQSVAKVYDPSALPALTQQYSNHPLLCCVNDVSACVNQADAILILTGWQTIQSLTTDWYNQYAKGLPVFDGRNLYDPAQMQANGIQYFAVGRGQHV